MKDRPKRFSVLDMSNFIKSMNNNQTEIKGKNVLITGGTTGIGRATAKLLIGMGTNVMVFGKNKQHLDDALRELQGIGNNFFGMIADVANKEEVDAVFREFDNTFGNIDILINNAAMPARSIVKTEYLEWKYVVEVNILGYLYCSNEAIKRMKKNGSGHIINIGSLSAKGREADADVYVATKSAIEGFSESLRKQVNRYGIKVSLIEPGSVATNMVKESKAEQVKLQNEFIMLKPEDIAEAIVFCLTRPKRCDIICLEIRPHKQLI